MSFYLSWSHLAVGRSPPYSNFSAELNLAVYSVTVVPSSVCAMQYPGDMGLYWSVKSWYVTLDDGALASTERKVESGDYIFGNMTRTGPSSWFIDSVVGKTQQHTSISVTRDRLMLQPWAYNTIEGYGVVGCKDYPPGPAPGNTVQFTQLSLTANGKSVSALSAHFSFSLSFPCGPPSLCGLFSLSCFFHLCFVVRSVRPCCLIYTLWDLLR